MEKFKNFFLILGGILVVLVAFGVAKSLLLTEGFPKGVDAYGHMTRIAWILKYFPQINWNPFWDSGTPFWIWTYPPLTALLSSVIIKVFGLTVEQGMISSGLLLMMMAVLGLYVAAYIISGSWPIALFTTILTVTTPAFWSWWGHGGNYARIWGMAFYFWSFAALVWYLKKPSKTRFFILVVLTASSLQSHLLYGGLTVLTFGAYLLFAIEGWRRKIITGAKILIPTFLLSAYWYFPLFLTSRPQGRYVEGAFGGPVTFNDIFFLNPEKIFFTLPTQFTVIVASALILGLFLLIMKRYPNRLVRAVVLGLGLGVLGSFFYVLVGNIPNYPEKGYLAVFPPFATLPLVVFFSAYFLAGVLSGLPRFIATTLSLVLTTLVAFLFILNLPFNSKAIYDVSRPGNPQVISQESIAKIPLTPDYRFGTDSAFIADWFNFIYPQLPQTRDYIYQGIPFKNWQFFWEWLVWTQPDRFEETQFLFDWYGVKYFSVGFASANNQYDKFLDHPDFFEKLIASPENYFYLFAYQNSTPITSFVKAPTLLMIGGNQEFETLVRVLAISNFGTRKIIPVYGKEKLNLPLEQLKQFDVVFLYNYKSKNLLKDAPILAEFVRQGGRLLIESNRGIENNPKLESLPDPFPINKIELGERKGEWSFEPSLDFASAVFGNDSWKIDIASQLKPWAEVQLSSAGKPVIVSGQFGQGKVIWSGINLPYHTLSFQNKKESDYFGTIIEAVLEKSFVEEKEEKVVFSTWQPEKRIIDLSGAPKGILLKESYFSQWHASLQGSKLNIYKAGPNLMYIPLPKKTVASGKVVLDYQTSIIEKLGWLTSLATIILLILNLIFNFQGRFSKFFTRLERFNLKRWWEKEEEI